MMVAHFAEAALADIDAWCESPVEIEVERQRSAWANYCRGRSRRPTPTSTEKRRATAISFDDTPREALAAAWAGAPDRDRRDLINRAIGMVAL